VLGAFVFLSPTGALVAVAAALPLVAALVAATRHARIRAVLGLRPPRGRNAVEVASLAAVPLLLALAAAGPAIRSPAGRGRAGVDVGLISNVSIRNHGEERFQR